MIIKTCVLLHNFLLTEEDIALHSRHHFQDAEFRRLMIMSIDAAKEKALQEANRTQNRKRTKLASKEKRREIADSPPEPQIREPQMTICICGYRNEPTKIANEQLIIANMLHLRLSYLQFWSGTRLQMYYIMICRISTKLVSSLKFAKTQHVLTSSDHVMDHVTLVARNILVFSHVVRIFSPRGKKYLRGA